MCFYQNLNTMLIVDEHCIDICDEFPVPQTERKSKQVKEQWHGKFYLRPVWRTTRYLKQWKYQNLWMNNKVIGNKYAICLHFLTHLLNICRKFEFLIFQHSVATYLRWGGSVIWVLWQISYAFQHCKNFDNLLRYDKVTESLKVGTFFEAQCRFMTAESVVNKPISEQHEYLYMINSTVSLNITVLLLHPLQSKNSPKYGLRG